MTRFVVTPGFTCALLMTIANGCAADDPADGPDATGPDSEVLINGKPAAEFYAQFTHAVTKTALDGAAAFPAGEDGRNAFLAHIFLMPDAVVELFYAEGEGEVSPSGYSVNTIASTQKRRTASWSIDGTKLVLGDLMTCTGLEQNGKDVLRCTLDRAIVSPAAAGRAGTFKPRFSPAHPDDSEFAGFVP